MSVTAFLLSAGSVVCVAVLLGVCMLGDMLFDCGGDGAVASLPAFFVAAFGFLFFAAPLACLMSVSHTGNVALAVLAAITAIVADAMLAVRLLGMLIDVIDAFLAPKSGSASTGRAYARVASRGNGPDGTGSDCIHGHARALPMASMVVDRSSREARSDGRHACPDGLVGGSNE